MTIALLPRLARLALLIAVGASLAACCPIESRFFRPQARTFDTPAGVEDVWLDVTGDERVHAWFVPGASAASPTLVFLHGNATQIDALHPLVGPIAAEAGANLLMVSYRGYGRSSPRDCVTRDTIVADARAAIAAVRERDDVDPDRLVVFGYSMGGVAALASSVEAPGVVGVIVGGTYANSDEALEDVGKGGFAWLIPNRHEPIENVRRLRVPLLIVHGSLDDDVSVDHAERLVAAARDAGVDVTLHVAENANHYNLLQVDPELATIIAAFVTEVGAGAHSATTK